MPGISNPPSRRMLRMDRRRCWLVPMRPVTPFMMTPIRRGEAADIFQRQTCWERGPLREGGRLAAGAGKGAREFLAPVGHVPGGTVAIDEGQGLPSQVGELVENTRRNIDDVPRVHGSPLPAQAHFAGPLHDVVDLLLLLIVPGHLASVRVQDHGPHAEAGGLNGRRSAHQVPRLPAGGETAGVQPVETGNDHLLRPPHGPPAAGPGCRTIES